MNVDAAKLVCVIIVFRPASKHHASNKLGPSFAQQLNVVCVPHHGDVSGVLTRCGLCCVVSASLKSFSTCERAWSVRLLEVSSEIRKSSVDHIRLRLDAPACLSRGLISDRTRGSRFDKKHPACYPVPYSRRDPSIYRISVQQQPARPIITAAAGSAARSRDAPWRPAARAGTLTSGRGLP